MTRKLQFQTNVPIEVALAFDQGKQVEGKFGPQVMFSLAQAPQGETIMYVPPIISKRIAELGIQKGEPIQILKAEVVREGKRAIEWRVKRKEPAIDAGAAAGPQVAKPEGPAAVDTPTAPLGAPIQSITSARGQGSPPLKVQFERAFEEFLVMGARAVHNAETRLAAESISLRADNRDNVAVATTMFIEAARRGSLIWTPEAHRDAA